jgi:hypothetical protein
MATAVDLKAYAFEKEVTKRKSIKRAAPPRRKKWSKQPVWDWLGDDVLLLVLAHLSEPQCVRMQRLSRNTHRLAKKALRKQLALGDSQWQVFRAVVERGESVFLTGPPGTGKSHLLRMITSRLDESRVVLTASTGAAAEKIGAQTLHSAFCLGHSDSIDVARSIAQCKSMRRFRLFRMRTLVIDEVSMLTSEVLDAVRTIVDAVCAADRVQFVLCGDPLQLGEIDPGGRHASERRSFWKSELLTRVARPYVLVENFRQDGESEFASILNRARVGKASERDVRWLLENSHPSTPAPPTFFQESHIERVRRRWRQELNPRTLCLFCLRAMVDDFNQHSMRTLPGVAHVYNPLYYDRGTRTPWDSYKTGMEHRVSLKVGARVMLTRNQPGHEQLFNGSMGTVLGLCENSAIVNFDAAGRRTISRMSTKAGATEVFRMPLQVAWAATIHKAQGATLDRACVDLSFAFGHAQAYVALSRVRDVKDLEIIGLDLTKLNSVDKVALRWYNSIKEASQEHMAALEAAEAARYVPAAAVR